MLKKLDETTKLFIIGIVFLLMILFILFTSITDKKRGDYRFINEYYNSLKDNYSLSVKTEDKEITYFKDGDIELFESDNFKNKKYVKYDGKTYIYEDDKLYESLQTDDLNDKYNYDMELIKSVSDSCDYKKSMNNTAKCIISADMYNNTFQSLYGLGRLNNDDVVITVYYNEKSVNGFNIDYSDSKYDIKVKDTNKNDLKYLLELMK